MILTESFILISLVTFVTSIVILLTKHLWDLSYWKRKGVPGPKPSVLVGTLQDFCKGKKPMVDLVRGQYEEYKSRGYRYYGGYFAGKPHFSPIDLDLVKSILQTDFQHFHSRGQYSNEAVDPLSVNLVNLDGTKWRDIRAKLTPTFTLGKLKQMYHILILNSQIFKQVLIEHARVGAVDIKELSNRFTIDNISLCAFGLDANSLKNPNTEFFTIGSQVFEPSLVNLVRNSLPLMLPHGLLKAVQFSVLTKLIKDFFHDTVTAIIKFREENKVIRDDFMSMMIEMKNTDDPDRKLTINEIASQSFIFFAAGFETASTATTFASYELAVNNKIQEKLREEIDSVLKKHNNELTYEAVNEMEYLHQVIQETLRKHPPVSYLIRKCTENYTVPGDSLDIEKGTIIGIPLIGIHYDPEYYPEPEIFNPDRFSEENKNKIPSCAWLPFGEGPRTCIGELFGMHQTKIGLITLIRNFDITLNKRTANPIVYRKIGIVTAVEGEVWLDLEKLK